MSRTAIVYASKHHGNTYKVVKAISEQHDVDQIDAEKLRYMDLSPYDLIGFASGIDFGRFYPSVERFLKENLPQNKKVFFLYTCARKNSKFTEAVKQAALDKGAVIMGEYGCRGYNTYGPWKAIGGMNKNHPSQKELEEAIHFYEALLNKTLAPDANHPEATVP